LQQFLNIAFCPSTLQEILPKLNDKERQMIPPTFEKFVLSDFSKLYIFHENIDALLICFKIVLEAAKKAKLKFSIQKSTFIATKIQMLGYTINTMQANIKIDAIKSSGFLNMKKPSTLYELQSRLCTFKYFENSLPYLKEILYPLHFIVKQQKFSWGPVEELAWTQAKRLVSLGLTLSVPDESNDLVLTTDASKIAASACLFCIKNDKLQLVSASSKYFNTADLNRNSYTLEAISLAYALKTFAPYLLNCKGKIRIFTDAKSLIYAKRLQRHSYLINNVLNYITNFLSLIDVELYHLPGQFNVLADVLSRAINENLNCALPKEHPISKEWAKSIPPIPEIFGVTHETLYKFLVSIPQPEHCDLYDRSHRRLQDPKILQTTLDHVMQNTPEERYNSAIVMLEKWNDEYCNKYDENIPPHVQHVHTMKMTMDLEAEKKVLEQIYVMIDKIYPEIKDDTLYKDLQENLEEASKRFLIVSSQPLTESNINFLNNSIFSALKILEKAEGRRNVAKIHDNIKTENKSSFVNAYSIAKAKPVLDNTTSPTVFFRMKNTATFIPKFCS
jgi:hypothetical protein